MKSYFIGAGMGLVLAAFLMGYSARHGEEDMTQHESVPVLEDVQQEVMTEVGEEQLEDLQWEAEDEQAEELQAEAEDVVADLPIEAEDVQAEDLQTEAEDELAETEDQASEEVTIEQEGITGELRGFNEEEISLEVKSGDTSLSVSRRLVDAGVVEDASLFDQYLCEEGYARTIRVGSYVIPAKVTWEEIALLITN